MISEQQIIDAIRIISQIDGLAMNADDLVDDVVLLAQAWPDEEDFQSAVLAVSKALEQLINKQVSGTPLLYRLKGWDSYHFQHRKGQREKADMRIVYRITIDGIAVKGFGARHKPQDFYRRMLASR
ncbi:hypothetical protein [Bifidobacterium sp. SO1]|uniref:hypothetical protein n=1 Tax=Bifidobacterium sp. SO1 TaxID=2809029 RepID=UPI001BDCF1DD|nr:hypothetical protein [Bifidobacterium sp. SO1]MBT1162557.1 hypothetical protein [Bifidobacterium sp. SO1]